jgi:hypothetical protein
MPHYLVEFHQKTIGEASHGPGPRDLLFLSFHMVVSNSSNSSALERNNCLEGTSLWEATYLTSSIETSHKGLESKPYRSEDRLKSFVEDLLDY